MPEDYCRLFSIENLPELKKHRSYLASSYDRKGGNYDFGNYELIQDDEGVILDVDGPGIITRIWSANPYGRLRIFLDQSDTPQIDQEFDDFLSNSPIGFGNGKTVDSCTIRHSVTPSDQESRGRTSYLPIAFNKGCKITITPASQWLYYQVNYSLFDEPHGLSTFSFIEMENISNSLNSVIDDLQWDFDDMADGCHTASGEITLQPGERTTIFQHEGQILIKAIRFEIEWPKDQHVHNHLSEELLLRGYFDNIHQPGDNGVHNTPPAIRTPLSAFFMDFGVFQKYNTLFVNKYGDTYEARFPMPVQHNAQLELINQSCITTGHIRYEIIWQDLNIWNESTCHFHAVYHSEDLTFGRDLANYQEKVMYLENTSGADNYHLLKAWGKGHFIGCAFLADTTETPFTRAMGESDDVVFVDNDPGRTMWGTGNEDYINDAWGFHGGITPFAGGDFADAGMFGYRFHLSDSIPFQKSIDFTLEHGSSNNCTVAYKSIAFYYLKPVDYQEFSDGVAPRSIRKYWNE